MGPFTHPHNLHARLAGHAGHAGHEGHEGHEGHPGDGAQKAPETGPTQHRHNTTQQAISCDKRTPTARRQYT